MDHLDAAALRVLSNQVLPRSAPHAAKLTGLYPDASGSGSANLVSILAETVTSRGQLIVSGTSLRFGTACDFMVSSPTVMRGPLLNFGFTMLANQCVPMDGLGFRCIQSIEISMGNGLQQAMIITGEALYALAMLHASDENERARILRNAGQATSGAVQFRASIPLTFLMMKGTNTPDGSYGYDGSVLSAPLRVLVNWAPVSSLVKRNQHGAIGALPASLDYANLTFTTAMLQDAAFSVRNAMMNSGLILSIPSMYVRSDVFYQTVAAVTDPVSLVVNSCPAGQLDHILLRILPDDATNVGSWFGNSGAEAGCVNIGSLQPETLELLYSGQTLYRANSAQERRNYNQGAFGSDLGVDIPFFDFTTAAFYTDTSVDKYRETLIAIPLTYNAKAVVHHSLQEHTPSYGGSSLTFAFSGCKASFLDASASPYQEIPWKTTGANDPPLTTTRLRIEIIWVLSALTMFSNNSSDLQL